MLGKKDKTDVTNAVRSSRWSSHWKRIVGVLAGLVVFCTVYALILPAITLEIDAVEHTWSYEDDTVTAQVTLPADSEVPEDAVLQVSAVSTTDDSYTAYAEQAQEAVTGEAQEILLYDISFYTADGEYLSVSDSAEVSIQFKESVFGTTDGEVAVLHYTDDGGTPVSLSSVEVSQDENAAVTGVDFKTEGFSLYAVVNVVSPYVSSEGTGLDGRSFLILSHNAKYAMMVWDVSTSDTNGRLAQDVSSGGSLNSSNYTAWTFTSDGNGGYYISSGEQYLKFGAQTLTLTTTQTNASVCTVTWSGGRVAIKSTVDSTDYYLNLFGGELSSNSGFKTYTADSTNLQYLYEVSSASSDTGEVTTLDLDGKIYAIVNENSDRDYALSSTASDSSNTYLNGTQVTVSTYTNESGTSEKYVSGTDLTLWKFEAVSGTSGSYYIEEVAADGSTGTGNYLTLTRSALSTSTTSCAIAVSAGADTYAGQVMLSADSTTVDWYGGNNANTLVFGSYAGAEGNNYQTLCKLDTSKNWLTYDLNVTSSSVGGHVADADTSSGSSWGYVEGTTVTADDGTTTTTYAWVSGSMPTLDSSVQNITTESTPLYTVHGTRDAANGYYCLRYRDTTTTQNMIAAGKSPGKQFKFEGWSATATDGNTYLFAEGASAVLGDDGYIHITDTTEVDRTLEPGTTLTGQWTEISDLVQFYVNYSGTVLDTEGDVSGRNQKEFTGIIAIGHVYYGKSMVGVDGTFGNDANEAIRLKFVNSFDVADTENTQVVLDYRTTYDSSATDGYSIYNAADGKNDSELEESLMAFIQQNGAVTIKISTSDNSNNPTIENDNATTDNYSVRWYVLKEQSDSWHVDGVMVAKTAEISVSKTFSGLSPDTVASLLGTSESPGFQMPVLLGTGRQAYITMSVAGIAGQYDYNGLKSSTDQSLTYNWTLHAITDEQYTLQESGYSVTNYNVSTQVTHYYTDSAGTSHVVSQKSNTTEGLSTEVVGGQTTAVVFQNYYTPSETGALLLSKQSENGEALKGATFTLTKKTDTSNAVTATSGDDGDVYFSGLSAGTYILTETGAPSGYKANTATWTVEVTQTTETVNGSETKVATVKVYQNDANGDKLSSDTGTVCFDSSGLGDAYVITNDSDPSTIQITKTFVDLSAAQMQLLSEASAAAKTDNDTTVGYYLELTKGDETSNTETVEKLHLSDATVDSNGFTYTWTVPNLSRMDDNGNAITYQVTEHHYLCSEYADSTQDSTVDINVFSTAFADTVVAATVNGTAVSVGDGLEIQREIEGDTVKSATATVGGLTLSDDSKTEVALTNTYTNTFTLTLQKQDSVTGEALPGAIFDVYGPYRESSDTSKSITYTDADTGATKTAYFIKQITADSTGIATMTGLNLSDEEANSFVYVIDESYAPEGYSKLNEPVVNKVTVTSDGYLNGVYRADVPNVLSENARTYVTVTKAWDPDIPTGASATMELYRIAADETIAEKVGEITLTGTVPDGATKIDPSTTPSGTSENTTETVVVEYGTDGWTVRWSGLLAYKTVDDESKRYTYYIREKPPDDSSGTSYVVSYGDGTTALETVMLTLSDGSTVWVSPTTGSALAQSLTVTNAEHYELPETGGIGTFWFTIGGALFVAAGLLYGHGQMYHRERRRKD